jgi:hypothetical protein
METEKEATVRAVIQRIKESARPAIRRVREYTSKIIKEGMLKANSRLKMAFLTLYQAMLRVIERAREFVRERGNQRVVRPRSTLQTVFFLMYIVVFSVVVLWGTWWLPQVDVESARSALSAQAATSGTLLGLLIAAMVFRWSGIANREQGLWNKINLYLRELAVPVAPAKVNELNRFVVDVAYDEYLSLVNEEKGKGQKEMREALRMLGRFWVIKRLSLSYSIDVDMTLSRDLREGVLGDLSGVSKESAVSMWESYFVSQARFVLEMHDALQYVSRMLAIHRQHGELSIRDIEARDIAWSPVKEYVILEKIVGMMRSDDTWLIAGDVRRWRSIGPLFYLSSGFLFTAMLMALTILTGLGGFERLLVEHSSTFLWIVGVPIGLAIFGAYNCIVLVFAILR